MSHVSFWRAPKWRTRFAGKKLTKGFHSKKLVAIKCLGSCLYNLYTHIIPTCMSECNMFDGPKTDINLDIDETWNSEPEKARFSNRTDADFCFSAEASVKGRLRTSGPAENGDHGPQHFGPSQGSAFFWSLWRLQGHCWNAEGCHTYTVTRIIWEFWFAVFKERKQWASNWQHPSEAFAPAINPRFVRCLCNSGLLTLSILVWQKGLSHRTHLSQLVESGAIWHLIALNFLLRPIGIPTLIYQSLKSEISSRCLKSSPGRTSISSLSYAPEAIFSSAWQRCKALQASESTLSSLKRYLSISPCYHLSPPTVPRQRWLTRQRHLRKTHCGADSSCSDLLSRGEILSEKSDKQGWKECETKLKAGPISDIGEVRGDMKLHFWSDVYESGHPRGWCTWSLDWFFAIPNVPCKIHALHFLSEPWQSMYDDEQKAQETSMHGRCCRDQPRPFPWSLPSGLETWECAPGAVTGRRFMGPQGKKSLNSLGSVRGAWCYLVFVALQTGVFSIMPVVLAMSLS